MKHPKGSGFESQCKSGSILCPWHNRLYDAMFIAGYPWWRCMNECHEFNAVKIPLYSLP